MALVIDLKPGEKVLVGTAVITNHDQHRTRLHIAGNAPILREKDVMKEEQADTPCKRIYFLVQCMYLARNAREYHARYFDVVRQIQEAAPSTTLFVMKINDCIIEGSYYRALKEARELIEHERELIDHVQHHAS